MVLSLLRPVLSKISRKASLRVILACLVLQIPAAVGLTGYLSFRNGQQAVDDLANQLTDEIGDHVEHSLEDFVATPQLVTRLNADEVRDGVLNLDDLTAVQNYLWRRFQHWLSSARSLGGGYSGCAAGEEGGGLAAE
jgi:hypothetical protein